MKDSSNWKQEPVSRFDGGEMIRLGAVDKTAAVTSTTIDNTIPELWTQKIEDYVKAARFMERFMVTQDELVSKPGDVVYIWKRSKLTAAGNLTATSVLEGNEETFSQSRVAFTPAKVGNAIRVTAEALSKSILDLKNEATYLLGDWMAEKKDLDAHAALRNGVLSANTRFGGSKTTAQSLTASDKLVPADISKIKYEMSSVGVPRFKPGDSPGMNEGYFVGIFHPYTVYDLTQHADYKTAASYAAQVNANKVVGPMFQGFDAFWDGVLIYQSGNVRYATTGGYSIKVAANFVMGPRAMAEARGLYNLGPGYIWKEKLFDYDQDWGIALITYYEDKVLNTDQLYSIYCAATDLSAAGA